MSRTVRQINPRIREHVAESLGCELKNPDGAHPNYVRHQQRILRGDDGAILSDKCPEARIDSEGGFKLNTWDWVPTKANARIVKRRRRISGQTRIRNDLDDLY